MSLSDPAVARVARGYSDAANTQWPQARFFLLFVASLIIGFFLGEGVDIV